MALPWLGGDHSGQASDCLAYVSLSLQVPSTPNLGPTSPTLLPLPSIQPIGHGLASLTCAFSPPPNPQTDRHGQAGSRKHRAKELSAEYPQIALVRRGSTSDDNGAPLGALLQVAIQCMVCEEKSMGNRWQVRYRGRRAVSGLTNHLPCACNPFAGSCGAKTDRLHHIPKRRKKRKHTKDIIYNPEPTAVQKTICVVAPRATHVGVGTHMLVVLGVLHRILGVPHRVLGGMGGRESQPDYPVEYPHYPVEYRPAQ